MLDRYADDVELDASRKDVERWGDPMLLQIQKQRKKEQAQAAAAAAIASGKKAEASASQEVKRLPRPMYLGDPWPNRLGIKPGYRWDGRDRSNKWEEKLFAHKATAKNNAQAAYKWSSEDM